MEKKRKETREVMGDSGLVDYLTSLPLRRIDDYVVESSAAQVMCRKFESDFPYYSVTTVVDSSGLCVHERL